MKQFLTAALAVAFLTLFGGCEPAETNEEESARMEQYEREQGYPSHEGLRPRSTANF